MLRIARGSWRSTACVVRKVRLNGPLAAIKEFRRETTRVPGGISLIEDAVLPMVPAAPQTTGPVL